MFVLIVVTKMKTKLEEKIKELKSFIDEKDSYEDKDWEICKDMNEYCWKWGGTGDNYEGRLEALQELLGDFEK